VFNLRCASNSNISLDQLQYLASVGSGLQHQQAAKVFLTSQFLVTSFQAFVAK
jgi:hypothetical protein